MKKDFQPEQMLNNEPLLIGLPSATDSTKPHVVRSPNILSTDNIVEKFEEGNKNEHGRFVHDSNGKVIGVELVTLLDANDVFIPTDNKAG
jgi:hypothetical protein